MSDVPQVPMVSGPSRTVGTPRSIGKCVLLAIVTLGIYTFVWTWKTHEEIKQYSGQGVGGAVGFLIYFVVSPVTYFLLPSEVKKMFELDGKTSPVKPIIGLWMLLPLIGALVWFSKVQGALNTSWTSKGATMK